MPISLSLPLSLSLLCICPAPVLCRQCQGGNLSPGARGEALRAFHGQFQFPAAAFRDRQRAGGRGRNAGRPSFPLCHPSPLSISVSRRRAVNDPLLPLSLSLSLLYLGCRGVVEPMDPIGLGAWIVLPAMKLQKGSWDSSPRPSYIML